MIVLDTNVVSEALRPTPDERVLAWLNDQIAETLYLTSVTIAEMLYGVAAMPDGARKSRVGHAIGQVRALFTGRVLVFDESAAAAYADLAVRARRSGHGFPLPDGYIAAIAAVSGFAVATRDHAPFEAAGLRVIDPWR